MTGITAAELADVRIPRRRTGLRYAISAVDDFLERAAADLRKVESGVTASLSSDDVTLQEFPTVGLFGLGYEADAVDALLDGISAQLNRRRQSAQHGQLRSAQDASDEAKLREMLERIRRGEL
jgi:DivIVA domain-containing protein